MLTVQTLGEQKLALREMTEPALPKKGALIRVKGCGLCGSDLDKLIHNKVKPGTVLGHEVVGVIQALHPEHQSSFTCGDRVVTAHHVACGTCHYCLNASPSMCRHFKETNLTPGGFSQIIALSQEHLHHTVFKIPDPISDEEASCMEPLACVLRAIERGGVFINGSVAVIGLGFIGLMASQVYKNKGYQVLGFDVSSERLELATLHQFIHQGFHPVEDVEEIPRTLAQTLPTGRVDVVFLSVVNAKTVALALDTIREGGTIVLFASASDALSDISLSELYFREIRVIPSYSPSMPSLKEAAEMIFTRQIRLQPFLTHRFPLEALSEAMDYYRSGKAIKVYVQV